MIYAELAAVFFAPFIVPITVYIYLIFSDRADRRAWKAWCDEMLTYVNEDHSGPIPELPSRITRTRTV